jgi:DNA-binding NarL/FixJ family response regulator
MVIQLSCFSLFMVDLLYEVHLAAAEGGTNALLNPIHLISEGLALLLLGTGFGIANSLLRRIRSNMNENRQMLESLRGQFDSVIAERFHAWGLSSAESDIALLSIRGLKICEIAQLRHTAAGTIKAQLSAVYKKSGVASRTELLALFMDEFLDQGSKPENAVLHKMAA